jgi:uncharacterized membrane protein HdeD (DUF308 family)
MERKPTTWIRTADIVLGILSIIITLVVVLNPSFGTTTIVSLLAFAVILNSFRMASAGGLSELPPLLRGLSLGLGALTVLIVALVILSPGVAISTLAVLFATGLAIQGIERLAHTANAGYPRWLRASALTVGATTLALAGVIATFPRMTHVTLVALLTVTIVVNGVDGILVGMRPSSAKQLMLVKLGLFALFYGFVNVNWIDLYYNRVPAYQVWLIMTYMAPFIVLLVFRGLKDWELAASLGLLVSLVNDLGYYFSGDLFFGFHVKLIPWLQGQLGLEGTKVLFTFQGGLFRLHVTSYMMGASVYLRFAAVVLLVYYWWRRPSDLSG